MKYCTHCGKELVDEAVVCIGCGCAVAAPASPVQKSAEPADPTALLNTLSERIKINGIIWLTIGILQVLAGYFLNWTILIVGALNIISSIRDITYSKNVLDEPIGIVKKFESLVAPIIILIYNLIFGGIIGVAGSIYYFVGLRSFVMENKKAFYQIEYS